MEFGVCFVTCEGVILLHSRIFVLDHFDCAGRDLLLVLLRKTCQEKICCHALFCHAVRALTNDNRSRWESKLFPIIGHRPLQHRFLNYSKELRRALFAFDSYHVDRARGIN
ncbi:uncharacterized protein LOC142775603 isoform X2 [Rhipicephalus microplus]|uniref:uncharacterized protein LOC142775603 isoform X2 n=1 Tax=Rhipicephalus microplus TaxID=6941 RepID=UPI003F6B90E6